MPHCIIEYSKELPKDVDIYQIMKALNEVIFASNLFDQDSIKIRSMRYEDYFLSTKYQHFIHISLRILGGRSKKQKEDLAQKVQMYLARKYSGLNISLTTEICDIDQNSYQKL